VVACNRDPEPIPGVSTLIRRKPLGSMTPGSAIDRPLFSPATLDRSSIEWNRLIDDNFVILTG